MIICLVMVATCACFAALLAIVITLASAAVGDPDPLAWAKELARMVKEK